MTRLVSGKEEKKMTSAQTKRQKLSSSASIVESDQLKECDQLESSSNNSISKKFISTANDSTNSNNNNNNSFGVDVDDLTDDTDSEEEEDELDEETLNGDKSIESSSMANHVDIQEQLAAAGPAGVAAAAAIATARKRKRPHSFETNPSVRKRQQTRLIRKLRACIDEYTMRVGQQAVVLITMPGKAVHNFKVFGAQPLESVIRTCKHEIMAELEQALLEQAPQQFKEDANKHELPPLVIDGIPTPVEKMTQAQLRAFIPLMLKYSTGRGKPGWGKDTTRPPWWPETLPWANVRSDAREESEKQRISWTTTLRQIVTNCYKYHGRDDLLPTFDESEESAKLEQEQQELAAAQQHGNQRRTVGLTATAATNQANARHSSRLNKDNNNANNNNTNSGSLVTSSGAAIYSAAPAYASNFVHTISNSDGTVSLIQVDPANAQILTLPDGTQVRAVRLQTLGADSFSSQQLSELQEAGSIEINLERATAEAQLEQGAVSVSEASLGADGQIIVTGEDGTQSCYPMSSLVSIPASMYQQFASGGQQLSIVAADGSQIPANALTIHALQDPQQEQQLIEQQQQQQQLKQDEQQQDKTDQGELIASGAQTEHITASNGATNETEQSSKTELD